MKKNSHYLIYYLLFICFLMSSASVWGQRKMETLDRGVLAMPKSSSKIYISWRHLATDPDNIEYNVYYKTSQSGSLTKLNSEPIKNSTNYIADLSTSTGDYTFVVKSVLNGIEKEEPGDFTVPANTVPSRIVRDFDFEPLPEGYPNMTMKFCWPADLDGDGRYDFVMDRQNYGAGVDDEESETEASEDYVSPKVEAYTSEGEFLWRIDIGYNVKICTGHADMVTAYDMDGDGKAEVLAIVSEGTTFADGKVVTGANGTVTDYRKLAGSAPQWLSVINGQTGVEIDRMELPLYDQIPTTRTDKWKDISGHFIIAYLDGINPSLIYQYKNRRADGGFQGAHAAWSFQNKKLILKWANLFYSGQAEFHQVRVADVDGDGYDEFVEGGYVLDQDGSLLNNHTGVVHGDRHTLTDIDPDRPGLEHFFIQQNNPATLGMGLSDAATGELIKGVYMSGVGDVGRGICAAFDPNRRGLQFWSTMNNNDMYDSKGNLLEDTRGTFPGEALWFGPELSRYEISGIGSGGYNLAFHRYNTATRRMDRVTPNFYGEDNGNGKYYFKAANGGRAAFWGDILGDWREEMVCVRNNETGFVVLATWDETSYRQYSLMQNPAYRCQTTARGYYQTADVDFYMAADMPMPPIAPVQTADLYYTSSGWIDNNNVGASYTNGKSIMFDIRGGNSSYTLNSDMSPSKVWMMNPKGKDYEFAGTGKFTGSMDLIKSMQGSVTLNGNHDYTGVTRISEGKLFLNGTLESKVYLNARGIIGGNGTLNGGIEIEEGLNIEGGRLDPGNGTNLGNLIIAGNLELPGRNNLVFDIKQSAAAKNDQIHIQGDFIVNGSNNNLVFVLSEELVAGTLTLITYTGTTNATEANFSIVGLEGIPYLLAIEKNAIKIKISEGREPGTVTWSGSKSEIWDLQTKNFLNKGEADIFVPNDTIIFNDDAAIKTITVNETMPTNGMIFNNNTDYEINGKGSISGVGGLKKNGTGKLFMQTTDNTFTGPVEIDGGILEVSSLKDGGLSSSIGASSTEASNWVMRNATLRTTAQMATNRNMQVEGTLTVDNPTSKNSVLISGNIIGEDINLDLTGDGTLTLQGSNTFSNVTVKSGLLLLGSVDGNKYSLGDGKVTLLGGTFRMHDSNTSSHIGPFSNTIEVPEGASAAWDLPRRWRFTNKLIGGGTIQIKVPYVRADFNGDWSEFTGVIMFTGSDVRLNTAEARNMPNAEINLSGANIQVASNGGGTSSGSFTITLGALSGSGNLSGKNYYFIGSKNVSTIYEGIIGSGAGSLTKTGTGSLTLTNSNLYTNGTNIEDGALIVANTEGSATGTGSVTVNTKGSLMGTGTVAGTVTVQENGTIIPGLSMTSTGVLNLGANLNMLLGSQMVIKTNKTENDQLNITGSLALDGAILNLVNIGEEYAVGDSFTIFSAPGGVSGEFNSIVPASPGTGLMWNTSRIQEGIISIDNKLDQSITFDPLPIKRLNNVDFDPGATASSGLKVTYSSSNENVATIINNMIQIVGVGTTNITAIQVGNNMYEEATPVVQQLQVLSDQIEILSFKVNGEEWDINQRYVVAKDYTENIITVEVDAGPYVTIDKGNSFEANVTNPSVQTITINASEEGLQSKTFTFEIEKRFGFYDLVNVKYWNGIFSIDNNKNKNGGYKLKAYKWFRNGIEVSNQKNYNEKQIGTASYYAEVVTDKGEVLRTWDEIVTISKSKIAVYPNPAKRYEKVYVDASSVSSPDFFANTIIEVYSITGSITKKINLKDPITTIDIQSLQTGIYIIRVISKDEIQDFKLIVE